MFLYYIQIYLYNISGKIAHYFWYACTGTIFLQHVFNISGTSIFEYFIRYICIIYLQMCTIYLKYLFIMYVWYTFTIPLQYLYIICVQYFHNIPGSVVFLLLEK